MPVYEYYYENCRKGGSRDVVNRRARQRDASRPAVQR